MYCPYCPYGKSIMEVVSHQFSWLNSKPQYYIEELKCIKCGATLRTETNIVLAKEKKKA